MEKVSLNTKCGIVTGEQRTGYTFFRGIPYGKAERFEAPELITQFEGGSWDATAAEEECYQLHSFMRDTESFYAKEFPVEDDIKYTENLLEVSMVIPDHAKDLPVFVFIHGGGFETGHMNEVPHGACTAYVEHQILFVSVSYRLNIFGFYGGVNYGLMDQALAVRWVYENIKDYGGDPERITVGGQSAGAMSLMNLLCSESIRPYIKGAIMMSGAGVIPKIASQLPTEKAAPFWQAVREKAGAASLEEFKKLPPEILWKSWYEVSRSKVAKLGNKQPSVDGFNPPEPQHKRLKDGKIVDVPMLFGVTSQDMFPFMIYDMALNLGLKLEKQHHAPCFGYYFDRTPPGNYYKAYHACDLWYVFGQMEKCWRPWEETDQKLRVEMTAAVASFVKTQNPGWSSISKNDKGFRLFDGISDGKIYPSACRKKLWHSFLKEPGPL